MWPARVLEIWLSSSGCLLARRETHFPAPLDSYGVYLSGNNPLHTYSIYRPSIGFMDAKNLERGSFGISRLYGRLTDNLYSSYLIFVLSHSEDSHNLTAARFSWTRRRARCEFWQESEEQSDDQENCTSH